MIGHFYGKKCGCSSDSQRYHRKHSATGVLLHLGCVCVCVRALFLSLAPWEAHNYLAFWSTEKSENLLCNLGLDLSASKPCDSPRLRPRFLPLSATFAQSWRPQDARFPFNQKSLADGDFLCNQNGQTWFPLRNFWEPESGVKIISVWRYANLVHSGLDS